MKFPRNVSESKKKTHVTASIHNVMMQLRKCCNHPYLIEHPLDEAGDLTLDEGIVNTSGKMVVLDKMLKELKNNGHRVCKNMFAGFIT